MVHQCPDESHVSDSFFGHRFAAPPETSPLQIDANEIGIGIPLSQPEGIFSFSAAQFNHDRVGIPKIPGMPVSVHFKTLIQIPVRRLKEVLKSKVFVKMDQFFFRHETALVREQPGATKVAGFSRGE